MIIFRFRQVAGRNAVVDEFMPVSRGLHGDITLAGDQHRGKAGYVFRGYSVPLVAEHWLRRNNNERAVCLNVHARHYGAIDRYQVGELLARRQNAAGTGGALGAGPGDAVTVSRHEDANLILVD